MRGLEECQECGDSTGLAFECNGCGGAHCSTHQLPENHDCPAVGDSEQSQRWFTGPSSQQNRQAVHDQTVEPHRCPAPGTTDSPRRMPSGNGTMGRRSRRDLVSPPSTGPLSATPLSTGRVRACSTGLSVGSGAFSDSPVGSVWSGDTADGSTQRI